MSQHDTQKPRLSERMSEQELEQYFKTEAPKAIKTFKEAGFKYVVIDPQEGMPARFSKGEPHAMEVAKEHGHTMADIDSPEAEQAIYDGMMDNKAFIEHDYDKPKISNTY